MFASRTVCPVRVISLILRLKTSMVSLAAESCASAHSGLFVISEILAAAAAVNGGVNNTTHDGDELIVEWVGREVSGSC